MPEEALQHADSIIVGDAEGAWEQLLKDFQQNKLQTIYYANHNLPLDDYRLDRSIFKGKKYASVDLIQYTRGCCFTCDFCTIHGFIKIVYLNIVLIKQLIFLS